MRPLTKPKPFQRDGVEKIEACDGRALLADDMGLGKTFQAFWYHMRNREETTPAVIVCPAHLKLNWKKEALLHFGAKSEIIDGTKVPKDWLRQRHKVVIVNYDVLRYWVKTLRKLKPRLVVIDECHYIRNRTSVRAKACKRLCKGVPHVIPMSGTAVVQRPAEIWTSLNILHPKKFNSFFAFAFKFCNPEKTPWGWKYTGARNLRKLNRLLNKYGLVRRRKEDVLKDLPPKTRVVVPIQLDKEAMAEYQFARDDFLSWIAKNHKAKLRRVMKAAFAKVGYLLRLIAALKLKQVEQWVEDFLEASEGKLIVFGINKKFVRPIAERFRSTCVLVDGSKKMKDRQLAFEAFQHDDMVRLFVGNIQAAGTGWNGTAAEAVAIAQLPWTPGELNQAEDRGHRIGQLKKLFCYYLIASGTIEEKLCKMLQDKQDINSRILDGTAKSSMFDLLNKLVEALRRETWRQGTRTSSRKRKSSGSSRPASTPSTRKRRKSQARRGRK